MPSKQSVEQARLIRKAENLFQGQVADDFGDTVIVLTSSKRTDSDRRAWGCMANIDPRKMIGLLHEFAMALAEDNKDTTITPVPDPVRRPM